MRQRSFEQASTGSTLPKVRRDDANLALPFRPSRRFGTAFQANRPALDQFPIDTWTRLSSRVLRRLTPSELAFGDVRGELDLRREILGHFGPARQVHCDIDQVVVVSGVQQALDLLCRALLRAGDPVWLENPGYSGARALFQTLGATVIPVPVDAQGIEVYPISTLYTARHARHGFLLGFGAVAPRELRSGREASG